MSDRDEIIESLHAVREGLTRQLDGLSLLAREAGVPREVLLTPSGELAATPVLVALANVQIALLDATPPPDVIELRGDSAMIERIEVPPFAVCGVESYAGHPDTYRCELASGHSGSHYGRGRNGGAPIAWEGQDA